MLKFINTRRSVRKWLDKPVNNQDVHDIIEAGMNAPSAGNEQAWQMILLTDKDILNKISEFNQNVSIIKNAPVAILVCGDLIAEKYQGYHVHDCSAATENMLLAIHAKDLGGVWGNVFPDNITRIRMLLGLPEHVIPFSIVIFGYPETPSKYQTRFNKDKLHLNGW